MAGPGLGGRGECPQFVLGGCDEHVEVGQASWSAAAMMLNCPA